MLTDPPQTDPEILLIGGLTVDRFADRSEAAGGSVVHAARAMHLDGRRAAVVTLAGPEPAAQAGLAYLGQLADVHVQHAPRTIGFGHAEAGGRRTLTFTGSAGRLARLLPSTAVAILYAPVADELGMAVVGHRPDGATTGAALQGWLRALVPGQTVIPRRLAELAPALVDALAGCHLLVASVEDLAAEASAPAPQLAALRAKFPRVPVVALTAGEEGAWLSLADGTIHRTRVPRVVAGVSTVGAGDAFAAALLGGLARGATPLDAAEDAAALVAELLAGRTGRQINVVGDVHGMRDTLEGMLRDAGLADGDTAWTGGRDELWVTGDLIDRGPDGIGVVDLLRRLAGEASAAGGRVGSVLGNHEILILGARHLADAPSGGPGATFRAEWEANGGLVGDLERLDDDRASWLAGLPLAARTGPALLVHADATLYAARGPSLAAANRLVRGTLASPDAERWDHLLGEFSERRAFLHAQAEATRLLRSWGGRVVVHGHTPLPVLVGGTVDDATEPLTYAEGRAVAVDGGLYAGGRGFVYTVPPD